MSDLGIARLMTLRGFEITAPTVGDHRKRHWQPAPPPEAKLHGGDAAIFVRDAQMKALEKTLALPDGDDRILDKDIQPAVKSMLTAQRDIDRRVGRTNNQKTQIAIALLLSGAEGGRDAIPEHLRIGDGQTVEGDFTEVSNEPA
jgi:hypothetical protein